MQSVPGTRETRPQARELKFLIRRELAQEVRGWAAKHLRPDVHGAGLAGDEYCITSLYCDTPNLDVFHRRGSFSRAKYRVRRYGSMSEVFLERKLRTGRLLAKRRTVVPVADLSRLNGAGPTDGWGGSWFADRIQARGLAPTCQVSYRRNARVGSQPGGLMRLTMDDDLRVVAADQFAFSDESGLHLMAQHVIVELKFSGGMPPLFHLFLDRFQLAPAAISKYRLALAALRDELPTPAPPQLRHSNGAEPPKRDNLMAACSSTGERVPAGDGDALVLS